MGNDKNKGHGKGHGKGGVDAEGGEGGGTLYFSVNDLIWYYDFNNPTDPDPAPGIVLAETGENDFKVEITLADTSTRVETHVGTSAANSERYIEPRSNEGGPL